MRPSRKRYIYRDRALGGHPVRRRGQISQVRDTVTADECSPVDGTHVHHRHAVEGHDVASWRGTGDSGKEGKLRTAAIRLLEGKANRGFLALSESGYNLREGEKTWRGWLVGKAVFITSPLLVHREVTVLVPLPHMLQDFQMMSVGGWWTAPSASVDQTCYKTKDAKVTTIFSTGYTYSYRCSSLQFGLGMKTEFSLLTSPFHLMNNLEITQAAPPGQKTLTHTWCLHSCFTDKPYQKNS